jgi:hypothetical protein
MVAGQAMEDAVVVPLAPAREAMAWVAVASDGPVKEERC